MEWEDLTCRCKGKEGFSPAPQGMGQVGCVQECMAAGAHTGLCHRASSVGIGFIHRGHHTRFVSKGRKEREFCTSRFKFLKEELQNTPLV